MTTETEQRLQIKRTVLQEVEILKQELQQLHGQYRQLSTAIQNLEHGVNQTMGTIADHFNRVNKKVDSLSLGVEVAAEMLDETKFREVLSVKAKNIAIQQAEARKAAIAEAVANKTLVPAEKIDSDTIIGGMEKNIDGSEILPTMTYVEYEMLTPKAMEELTGKGIGTEARLGGTVFEVSEIYARTHAKQETTA